MASKAKCRNFHDRVLVDSMLASYSDWQLCHNVSVPPSRKNSDNLLTAVPEYISHHIDAIVVEEAHAISSESLYLGRKVLTTYSGHVVLPVQKDIPAHLTPSTIAKLLESLGIACSCDTSVLGNLVQLVQLRRLKM